MKRANLILNERLLNEASRLFGEKTYSATVNRALEEAIRAIKIKGRAQFAGSDLWEGDFSAMRQDSGRKK